MVDERESVAGLILCGGRSTRMGRDKATLDLNGKPLWHYAREALEPLVGVIIFIEHAQLMPSIDDAIQLVGCSDRPDIDRTKYFGGCDAYLVSV